MIVKKAAYLVAGAVIGVGVTTAAGSAAAGGDASPAAKPNNVSTAKVTLSGDKGRYLQFTGKETRPATFKGSVVFKQPIATGRYTLSLTIKGPAGDKTTLVYDIRARQR